jgi:hypothetical protein
MKTADADQRRLMADKTIANLSQLAEHPAFVAAFQSGTVGSDASPRPFSRRARSDT